MSKQRVLVLGVDDVIGYAVAKSLAASDWASPVVLASEISVAHGNAFERIECRLQDRVALAKALNTVDMIVAAFAGGAASIRKHAAAVFAPGPMPWQNKRIVHVTSMTVYGAVTGDIDEATDYGKELSSYALARMAAEQGAASYPNVVTLRPGCEYGPNCTPWSERVAHWLRARRIGDLGALGDGYCNLVYIDDVVAAVLKALQLSGIEARTFNLAMPQPPTWNDYFLLFGKALGAVPVKRISRRQLRIETKLLAPPLKTAELAARRIGLHLALPPAIPPALLGLFAQEIKLNSARATQQLGMTWTPLAAGLQRTARWFHERSDHNAVEASAAS